MSELANRETLSTVLWQHARHTAVPAHTTLLRAKRSVTPTSAMQNMPTLLMELAEVCSIYFDHSQTNLSSVLLQASNYLHSSICVFSPGNTRQLYYLCCHNGCLLLWQTAFQLQLVSGFITFPEFLVSLSLVCLLVV